MDCADPGIDRFELDNIDCARPGGRLTSPFRRTAGNEVGMDCADPGIDRFELDNIDCARPGGNHWTSLDSFSGDPCAFNGDPERGRCNEASPITPLDGDCEPRSG